METKGGHVTCEEIEDIIRRTKDARKRRYKNGKTVNRRATTELETLATRKVTDKDRRGGGKVHAKEAGQVLGCQAKPAHEPTDRVK